MEGGFGEEIMAVLSTGAAKLFLSSSLIDYENEEKKSAGHTPQVLQSTWIMWSKAFRTCTRGKDCCPVRFSKNRDALLPCNVRNTWAHAQ